MPIWEFYRILSTIIFTLWWVSMVFSGPLTAIKFNHWIYETVQASWWIKQDIDDDLGSVVGSKPANAGTGRAR